LNGVRGQKHGGFRWAVDFVGENAVFDLQEEQTLEEKYCSFKTTDGSKSLATTSGVASPKNWWGQKFRGPKCLTLGEQQHFVWETAFKRVFFKA